MKPLLNCSTIRGLVLALALTSAPSATRANVYATNLRLNGSTTNVVLESGQSVSISYLLNEPASGGLTIKIFSGSTVVRTLAFAGGEPATSRGTNTVTWNGKDDAANPAPGGTYAFSVTAAGTGYPVWTQTTDDTNSANQVYRPRGLAVDLNTNSLYYGRIYVANSSRLAGSTNIGDLLGFQKLNADASPAAEGIFSTGGFGWSGAFGQSPFKARAGADDRFYSMDASVNGVVMSWDETISTNSLLSVMRDDNNVAPSLFFSFFVTGSSGARQLYMSDAYALGRGVVRWDLQPNGTCATNDQGATAIPINTSGDMVDAPYDVVVDKTGNIYVVCPRYSDEQYRLMRFPPYAGTPLTNASWKVATNTVYDSSYVYALAVDPPGTNVAFAPNEDSGVGIFDAGNGSWITNIIVSGKTPVSVGWDNVGNLYVGFEGNSPADASVWQAWSPPGTNQATTLGLQTIQVLQQAVQILITSIAPSGSNFRITFTGPSGDSASAYTLLCGSVPTGITNVAATTITGSRGSYQAIVAANGPKQFYRIRRSSSPPVPAPQITSIVPSGANYFINFTGPSTDLPSVYSVLSGSVVGVVTNATLAPITGSGGVYQATVAASGPKQFYRISRSAKP